MNAEERLAQARAALEEISAINERILELKAQRLPLVAEACRLITGINIGDEVINDRHQRGEVESYSFISPTVVKLQVRMFKRGGEEKSNQVIRNFNYDQWYMVKRAPEKES